MVFFNCNACGEALKKNQVDKHLYRCRGCQFLSCVDCGKDFWGDDYQSHIKCMTEDEKYCGKAYVPKVNKGEVKQEQWIEKVQKAIEKSASNPSVRGLLENLKEYPNIPRKQQKFQNFLSNSLRVRNPGLIAKVWDLLMAARDEETNNVSKPCESNQNQLNEVSKPRPPEEQKSGQTDEKCGDELKKLNKREKKEKRREKKDQVVGWEEQEEKTKKSKKKKRKEEESQERAEGNEETVKKKKRKATENDEDVTDLNQNGHLHDHNRLNGDEEQSEDATSPKKKKKFRWEDVIVQLLESKGEMSLKKLRKKVLNEFEALDSANYNKENLQAKFEKKIKKVSKVKIAKDRVKLK